LEYIEAPLPASTEAKCEPPGSADTAQRQNRGQICRNRLLFAHCPAFLVDNRDNRPPRRWRAARAYTERERISWPGPCAFPLNFSTNCAHDFRSRRLSGGGCG